jgi:mono/diheme cytochrome c family protein
VRATILAAGGLACAGAAMTIAAFAGGGTSEDPKPAPAAAPARAAAHDGLQVWIQQGCGSCHTFKPANSNAPIGPDLQRSLPGKTRDYVMESIVLPNARAASGGYTTGGMPEDYAERIAPDDLDALVEFLMEGAR